MDNLTNLIKIYDFVCTQYDKTLKFHVQRFSNNHKPQFTDQEVITIMLYCTAYEKRLQIKEVYNFISNHMHDWFPRLPSYVAFTMRVNRLAPAFKVLYANIVQQYAPDYRSPDMFIVDSVPIVTCSGKRRGKVSLECTDKGYCSTKSMYYYGVKLHFLTSRVKGEMPFPESLVVTPASENDLNVFRDNWCDLPNVSVFADKIYQDSNMNAAMSLNGSEVLTPIKYNRGVAENVKQFCRAADDLFSHAVSAVRQPIESLFSWLIEKADIQRASKVRSTKGLMVHIFNKLAAVLLRKFAA